MTTEDFTSLCKQGIVILDGATGTELAKHGLPAGVCPEAWILEHPEAIHAVQSAYETAGSQIVYAPTFGANRLKLAEFGLETRTAELNRRLAEIARAGVSHALVFGDLAPTGKFVEPFGEQPFETIVEVYKEQAKALLEGGVDGFAVETMMDLQEARAALIAIRELCDLPVLVTMTFDASGRTLTGNTPASAIVALQTLGASAVGCNCSTGPDQMASFVAQMAEFARVPIVAKPNAGMPHLDVATGKTLFDMQSEEFGAVASKLVAAGA
ncbi:MAG: homocysteine S-methyltransferase family protein, partial [Victivallales bacterium]|nr:homocysteine S-methyltransferase family protein [Victivallales bacterium]